MMTPSWLGSPALADLVRLALDEDGVRNDITSEATVPRDARAAGTVVAKQAGRIAGLPLLLPESPLMRPFTDLSARALSRSPRGPTPGFAGRRRRAGGSP